MTMLGCALLLNASLTWAGWRFDMVDPLQLIETDYRVDNGIRVVQIDLRYISPCSFDDAISWDSTYGNKRTAYSRLNQLCRNDSDMVKTELRDLGHCLPSKQQNRHKRVVPLILAAGGGLVAAIGGKVAYRHWAPGSDLNRINALEESAKAVNESLKAVKAELLEAAKDRLAMMGPMNSTLSRSHDNKNAIIEMAQMAPDLSWTSSGLKLTLHDYKEGLQELKAQCQSRRLSMIGLSKLARFSELEDVSDGDTWIEEVYLSDESTLSLAVHINEPRKGAFVYEVFPIEHWANYTTAPEFVTYLGPKYVIQDNSHNCIRGIDKPAQRLVYETCNRENFRDPGIYKWERVVGTEDELRVRSKPVVLKMGDGNTIYCFYYHIGIRGIDYGCPPRPFRLPRNIGFNMTNINYTVSAQFIQQKNTNTHIRTPILSNHTDMVYESDVELLRTLRVKHESMVKSGILNFDKGTFTIPWEYTPFVGAGFLGILASLITIGKVLYSCACGQRAHGRQELEAHTESIKIYNGSNGTSLPLAASTSPAATTVSENIILDILRSQIMQQLTTGHNGQGRVLPQAKPLNKRPPPPVPEFTQSKA